MIGMDFISFVILLAISIGVSGALHFGLKVEFPLLRGRFTT